MLAIIASLTNPLLSQTKHGPLYLMRKLVYLLPYKYVGMYAQMCVNFDERIVIAFRVREVLFAFFISKNLLGLVVLEQVPQSYDNIAPRRRHCVPNLITKECILKIQSYIGRQVLSSTIFRTYTYKLGYRQPFSDVLCT